MKLIEFNIGSNTINIQRSFLGTECVYVNQILASKKSTLFGTTHNLKIDGIDYTIKYTVKNWLKKLTGTPTFELVSEGDIVSEYRISNSIFFSIQFILSLIIFYAIGIIFWTVIESAKRGFVFNAY